MCGIFLLANKEKHIEFTRFFEGLTLMRHRGPDGSGIVGINTNKRTYTHQLNPRRTDVQQWNYDANLAMGHRRLSILDISDRSAQPMRSTSGRYFVTYNGELYNYKELRKELSEFDCVTTGDTEILLHAFEKWGVQAVHKLTGMFAFVVYDSKLNRLYCVRDHFGVKPLYIYKRNNVFSVASELKAFYGVPDFEFKHSDAHLLEYRFFRYLSGGATLWDGVVEILPGHLHEFDLNTFKETVSCWWSLRPESYQNMTDYSEEYFERLGDSVKMQMISDVPVGTQLSAGLDSSVVTYFARRHSTGKLSSFTIGFEEKAYDESQIANRFSRYLDIDHHVELLTSSKFINNLDDVTWYFEHPINHPNSVGVFLLARLASSDVTVLLSGEGADEVLAGYRRRYVFAKWLPFFRKYGSLMHPVLSRAISLPKGQNLARFAALSKLPPECAQILDMAYGWHDTNLDRELLPQFIESETFEARRKIYRESLFMDPLTQSQNYDIQTYLPELLIRQDKLCMGASIENRVPFLDHHLVSWVMSLPPRYRLHGLTGKWILRKASKGHLPNFQLKQPKRGFSIPLEKWFAQDEFTELLTSLPELPESIAGILGQNQDEESSFYGSLYSESTDMKWIRMAFQLWQQEFQSGRVQKRLCDAEIEDNKLLKPGKMHICSL